MGQCCHRRRALAPPVSGEVLAAGAVLWRPGPDGTPEVALVHRPRYDDWSLPKGKVDPGEHLLTTATREVAEETGATGVLGRPLGEQRYELSGGRGTKLVRYWTMRAEKVEFTPTAEVDELRWLPAERARALLSYARDGTLLDRFEAGPADTATVLIVRHAHAGDRQSWPADDRLRPLSPRGRADAETLAGPLAGFGPKEVLSADLVRCVETVLPVAGRVGLPVTTEPALDEAAYTADRDRARRRLRQVVESGHPVVLCTQGGVIPDLMSWLARRDGFPLEGEVAARKGSTWALSVDAGRVVSAEYFATLRG